jgi:hypothetical protein
LALELRLAQRTPVAGGHGAPGTYPADQRSRPALSRPARRPSGASREAGVLTVAARRSYPCRRIGPAGGVGDVKACEQAYRQAFERIAMAHDFWLELEGIRFDAWEFEAKAAVWRTFAGTRCQQVRPEQRRAKDLSRDERLVHRLPQQQQHPYTGPSTVHRDNVVLKSRALLIRPTHTSA